ncbi:UNVERIFIED_CONTAM: hypothetical protein K2H54_000235 [Gekko kuhli]
MSGRLQLELRRTANLTAGKQAWWYAHVGGGAGEQGAGPGFQGRPQRGQPGAETGHARMRSSRWMTASSPAGCGILQSCFNLNSLSVPLKDGISGDDLEKQPYPVKVFKALLKQLEVEDYEAVLLTDAIRDWTDKDTVLVSSYGAEDAYYEGLTPPYLDRQPVDARHRRAAGSARGERQAVRPAGALCVRPLPNDKLVVNVNTIRPEQSALLVALYLDKVGLDDAKRVLTSRPQKGWKNKKEMTDQMPLQVSSIPGLDAALDVKSSYFEARLIAEVGDTRARLESVFVRGKDNKLERAGGRPAVVLVPGSDLIFRRVSLPGKYSRQSAAALPYLLEEQIASDVDELHLVVLGHQGHEVDLMAVDKEKMQTWLGWLEQAGLKSRQLLPDVLALPQATDGWSALQLGKEWLLRRGPVRASSPTSRCWPCWLAAEPAPVTIHSHTPPPAIAAASWQAADPELPMLLLARGRARQSGQPAAGALSAADRILRYWQQWRMVAVVAGALLVVAFAQRGGQTPQDGVLMVLTELAPTFAEVPGLKPEVLRFDAARGELRLQVTAPGFAEIERFRELAGKRFDVQQGEVRSTEGKGGQGRQLDTSGTLEGVVNRTAFNQKIKIARLQPQGQELQVWIDTVAFDDLLIWLATLADRHGVQVQVIEVARENLAPGLVKQRVLIAVLFLAAYLVFLLAKLPASLVVRYLPLPPLVQLKE